MNVPISTRICKAAVVVAVLAPVLCFGATITRQQGPTVVNGQVVESYEGFCSDGSPWRLWFTSSDGWRFQGPNGSGSLYSTPEPVSEAMKMCGEG
ncbi:MAG: hypothetical protein ACT4PZ_14135 [Panacagrimonas sp.]